MSDPELVQDILGNIMTAITRIERRSEVKPEPEMLPEYDFTGKKGVRGKYYHAYQQGHTVRIHQADDKVVTQYFTLEEGAVLLAPDVREYFPDPESVNQALRSLINLIPRKPARRKQPKQPKQPKADQTAAG